MSGDKTVGQWVGAAVGAVIGYFNPALGWAAGAAIGGAIGGFVDPPKGPTIEGPRLQDLNVQISSLGSPMGRIYGTVGIQGNVIWVENNELKEVVRKEKQGGKGGGGGATVKTYSYFATFAVALCEGPIDGIRRVWIGSDLVYNSGSSRLGTLIASQSTQYIKGNRGVRFRFYPGSADQPVDPRIEADLGAGRTPAFRGTAYIVFYDLPLDRYGNTLLGAQVKVEVVRNGSPIGACEPAVTWDEPLIGTGTYNATMSLMLSGGRILNRVAGGIETRSTDGAYLGMESVPTFDGFDRIHTAPNNPRLTLLTDGNGFVHMYRGDGGGLPVGPLGGDEDPYWGTGTCVDLGDNRYIVASRRRFSGNYVIGLFTTSRHPDLEVESPVTTSTQTGATKSGNRVYFWAADYIIGVDVDDLEIVGEWYVGQPTGYSNARTPLGVIGDLAYIRTDSASGAPYQGANVIRLLEGNAIELVCGLPDLRFHANLDDDTVCSVGDPAKFFVPGMERGGYEILGDVVRDELERSELIQPGDINTADLTDDVRGYRIAGVQQIRAVLSPLQGAYPFDLIPSGYQLKALRRGKASVKTIPVEELDARAYGSEVRPMLEQAREMDSQLPRKVTLRYLDATREYEINEQYSPERVSSQAVNIREFEMPLVLDNDQAAGIAEVLQYVPWLERTPMTFRLGPEHLDLEPADVITIDAPYGQFPLRLDSIKYSPDGVLECTARPSAPSVWTPNTVGADGVIPDEEVGLPANTIIELMDIPLIRDADDQPGFAAAMAGTSDGWEGGVLFRSVDNGQTWQDIQAWAAPVTMGYARNALAAHDGYVIDRDSELQVDLTAGALESITEAQMMTGLHWVAYGADQRWELIRFANAELQADGSYIVSTLIRGARGTEWATGLHQAGDAFVLLDDADVAGILTSVETLNLVMQWRGVSAGTDISESENVPFAYRGVNLRPLSPVHIDGTKTIDDWDVSWTRRSRYTTSWWTTGIERPMGEASESYEIDIVDSVGNKLRTLHAGSPAVTYTAAQQIEDFGDVVTDVSLVVYQISERVGRGYGQAASLTSAGGDPYSDNVTLLLHFDGDLIDVIGRTMTAHGNAGPSDINPRFGSGCLALDGNGDYLTASYDDAIGIRGSDTYTIELWAKPVTDPTAGEWLFTVCEPVTGAFAWLGILYRQGQMLRMTCRPETSGTQVDIDGDSPITLDEWHHIAMSVDAGHARLFADGMLLGESTGFPTLTDANVNSLGIGAFSNGLNTSDSFNGYIDEVRVTKNVARYTSSFTPPNKPFPNP